MAQFLSVWGAIAPQKRLVLVLAVLATLAAVHGLARVAGAPSMALLYSGLDGAEAGEVIRALESQGVRHEVRGDAIFVETAARDRMRMALAADGLPAGGIAGYELLDTLSGFGTTSQMFDAAYWRAREGELARTILSSGQVRAARVHIANASTRPFERGGTPTASVTLTMRSGAVTGRQADAVRHLVAAAVSGLHPADVAIIDAQSGLVAPGADGSDGQVAGGIDARAATLRANAERLLTARVGPGNAMVEVMVETETTSERISERILDPDSTVAVSSESETRSESATGSATGAVTVASNLPDQERDQAGSTSSTRSEARERTNYELSETLREQVRQPGDIRRMTVAVLVNGITIQDDSGQSILAPRPPEELDSLSALVASAVGLDLARGDVITIESMPFSALPELGTEMRAGGIGSLLVANAMTLVQLAVLALVILALALLVIRPVLTRASVPALPGAMAGALAGPAAGQLSPEPGRQAALPGPQPAGDSGVGSRPALTAPGTQEGDSPLDRLRRAMDVRSEDSVRLLRSWIETPESPREGQV